MPKAKPKKKTVSPKSRIAIPKARLVPKQLKSLQFNKKETTKKHTPASAPRSAKGQKAAERGLPVQPSLQQSLAASLIERREKPRDPSSPVCREVACELIATTNGYCRLHYIKNWKKVKRKELILKERKLNRYIEELVSKYPDKYIEAIRQDLADEKSFAKVISDLELEEGLDDFEMETETAEGIIDNIKRDVEDEGDIY